MLVAIFGKSENWVYTGFGIVLYAAVMLPRFYRCQDFSKSQVRKSKRKIFIRGLNKQYGFASQEFLVVRGNGWGFLWSGWHTRR